MTSLGLGLGLSKQRPLKPVDFPLTIAQMGDWLDYRTNSSVSDGSPVDAWVGRKGLLNLAATGTERPVWADDDGDGRAAVQFDGVDDAPQGTVDTALLYGVTGDFEQWFVVKGLSVGADNRNLWRSDSPSGPATQTNSIFAQTTPRLFWYIPSGADLGFSNAVDIQDDNWHVVRCVRSGSTIDFMVDGVNIGTGFYTGTGTWITDVSPIYLGSGGVSQFWLGSYRHALFFTGLLDADTAAELTSYLTTA